MAKILVVDDWPLNREFLATLLRYADHTVTEAADGAAALAALDEHLPDLVITDILMPIMDGAELARRMAANPEWSSIPVIFYTATYRVPEAQSLAAQCGVTTVIGKPSEPQEVLDAINGELGLPLTTLERRAASEAPVREAPPTHALQLAYAHELGGIRSDVALSVSELAAPLNGEAHRLRRVATRVDESFLVAQALSMKLATLIELGIELSKHEDLASLLAMFCRGARHVLGARIAVVCLLDENDSLVEFGSSGLDVKVAAVLRSRLEPTDTIFGEVLRSGTVRVVAGRDAIMSLLPPHHPGVSGLLVAPITSARRRSGWFYVADRVGHDAFESDDPHLASILAAQLATQYENCVLLTQTKLREVRARRLSRLLGMLSSINSAILRTHKRAALLDEACRVAQEEGGFPIVWVGWYKADGTIDVVAARGIDATVAAAQARASSGQSEQRAAAVAALHSTTVVLHRDLQPSGDGEVGPIAAEALRLGCRSAVTLPVTRGTEQIGYVVLYSTEVESFDAGEVALLGKLAGDISFALQYIEKEEELNYLAYYDPLTGLANATLFHERIKQLIDGRPRRAALFVVDIDRFSALNDSLGRHVGDRLLAEVAKRLAAVVPEPALLGRVGADSFAVAASSLRSDSEAGTVLQERLMSVFKAPFSVDDRELRVSARVGVAVYPADGSDAETLFKNAEAALNGAKAANSRFLFYSPQLNSRVADDLALEQQLRGALERREFLVYYQPKVAARTGQIVGLEALLRWHRPGSGVVSPDRFIRVLEDSELIVDVGRWVIEKALEDHRGWESRGLHAPRIAVNVSPIQLGYADFPDMVLGALRDSGITSQPLELEITESVIMADIDASTERLKRIHDSGVAIAIDDFGTGYSSLRYLAKLPVDTLKVDRSFIVRMTGDADSMTLVSTIINLAHAFQLTVVAEGVDSEDQANLLRLMKCDVLQGYLFGKPVAAAEVEALLLG